MKRLVFDLDNTLCTTENGDYKNSTPDYAMIEKLRQYKKEGFEIIISTSRNVRTYKNDLGKINANTLPIIIDWLNKHDVPYDEIYVGKPWCGNDGFYIDDKSIRPSEFIRYNYDEILILLMREAK
jgi:capsule biosynthesis phosphatase